MSAAGPAKRPLLGDGDLLRLPWSDALCCGIICAVPAILAVQWNRPLMAWAAIAAFWTALSDPGCNRSQRLVVKIAFALAGALGAGCGSMAATHLWLAAMLAAAAGWAGAYFQFSSPALGAAAILATTALGVATAMPGHDSTHALAYSAYFLIGSTWAIGFRLLVWPAVFSTATPQGSPLDWAQARQHLRENLHHRSRWFRYAMRVGLACALAVSVVECSGLDHGYWLILTTLMTMQPDLSGTLRLSWRRMLGTLLGSLLAFAIGLGVHGAMAFAWWILPLATGTFAVRRYNYLLYILFMTTQFVVVAHLAQPQGSELQLIPLRIMNSFWGGMLSIMMAGLVAWLSEIWTGCAGQ